MWIDAAAEEMAWVDYLFQDGDLVGLTAVELKDYMKYLVNLRMKVLGMEQVFEKTKKPTTLD